MIKKVVFLTPTYLPEVNGVSININDRVTSLKNKGISCLIIAPSYKEQPNFKNVKRYKSFPMPIYPGSKMPRPFSNCILNFIKDFDPDIIHVDEPERIWLAKPYLLKTLKKNYPIIGFYHTDHLSFLKEYNIGFLKGLLDSLIFKGYSSCHEVFAASIEAKERFSKSAIKLRINDYLGISMEIFKNVEAIREKKYISIIGRISADRGIPELIELLPKIKFSPAVKGIKFVGDGPLKTDVENLKLNIPIEITGFVNRNMVSDYIRESHLVLSGCKAEAFGLSLIESFALGTPVVCPDGLAVSNFKKYKMPVLTYMINSSESLNNAIDNSFKLAKEELNVSINHWDIDVCTEHLLKDYEEVKIEYI